jgi:glycosyltransferase involved in cell wall biosynthesis
MNILHLSLLAPPGVPAASGVPKVAGTLLRYMEPRDDVKVRAVTMVDGLRSPHQEQRGAVIYEYQPCRSSGKTLTLYCFESAALRKTIRRSTADVIHAQPTSQYLMAATASAMPSLITIHGLVAKETAGTQILHPSALANRIRDSLQRLAIRRARHIICLSPYVEDYLEGKTRAKRWALPNPIDEEFFNPKAVEWAGLRILCAGIVSQRKNQMLILRACALLKERGVPFSCRLIGPFAPGSEAEVRGYAESRALQDSVEIRGLVPLEEVEASYSWANVVALASREETMPLSLMQAMAGGRAVFGAKRAGIPALLNEGQYGTLFDSEDPRDLADCLTRFAKHPKPFIELAYNAKQHAIANFHPEAIATKTVAIYRAVKGTFPPQKAMDKPNRQIE